MKVKEALNSDYSAVTNIYEQLRENASNFTKEEYVDFIETENQYLALAIDGDNKAIGLIAWTIWPSIISFPKRIGFVQDLVVLKEHRRKGVGSLLISHVKDWAKAEKIEILHLQTDINTALIFYETNGFKALNTGLYYIEEYNH